jgi:hypothetical protein
VELDLMFSPLPPTVLPVIEVAETGGRGEGDDGEGDTGGEFVE